MYESSVPVKIYGKGESGQMIDGIEDSAKGVAPVRRLQGLIVSSVKCGEGIVVTTT